MTARFGSNLVAIDHQADYFPRIAGVVAIPHGNDVCLAVGAMDETLGFERLGCICGSGALGIPVRARSQMKGDRHG